MYAEISFIKIKQPISCGGSIGSVEDDDDDSDSIYSVVFVRKNLNCTSPIEVTYYSAKYPNICYHCGVNNVAETVSDYYPICDNCVRNKKSKVKRRANKNKKE